MDTPPIIIDYAGVIQTSLAPVFLLAGTAAFVGIYCTRLGKVSDRLNERLAPLPETLPELTTRKHSESRGWTWHIFERNDNKVKNIALLVSAASPAAIILPGVSLYSPDSPNNDAFEGKPVVLVGNFSADASASSATALDEFQSEFIYRLASYSELTILMRPPKSDEGRSILLTELSSKTGRSIGYQREWFARPTALYYGRIERITPQQPSAPGLKKALRTSRSSSHTVWGRPSRIERAVASGGTMRDGPMQVPLRTVHSMHRR